MGQVNVENDLISLAKMLRIYYDLKLQWIINEHTSFAHTNRENHTKFSRR